jgi:hypothetical protein
MSSFTRQIIACRSRTARIAIPLLAVLTAAALSGCGVPLVHDGKCHRREYRYGKLRPAGIIPDIRDHVIAVEGNGTACNPAIGRGKPYRNVQEYCAQLTHMFNTMKAFHAEHPDRKILIFVHGGLNQFSDSLSAADRELEPIMDAGSYPIFLDWNSAILATYGEHLTQITQGQTDTAPARKLLSPAYLLADAGRAVTRAPVVWSNQIGSDLAAAHAEAHDGEESQPAKNTARGFRWVNAREGRTIMNLYKDLKCKEEARPGKAIRVYLGDDHDTAAHFASLSVSYILTCWSKFGLSPIIDWIGTPGWDDMYRRTLMAYDGQHAGNPRDPDMDPLTFQKSHSNDSKSRDGTFRPGMTFDNIGAFEVFRERLFDHIAEEEKTGHPFQVTMIGHSMGAMVLNEWFLRDVLEGRQYSYPNIVYMAAACSVRDFRRTVIPYMLLHDATCFHSLMLHPVAELRERDRYWDLPPRGSLLVWIDDFFENPHTPLDRTMGRWDNMIPAASLIPEKLRGRITLKAFALAPYDTETPPRCMPDYGPQSHGQFRSRAYWFPEFWYSECDVLTPVPSGIATSQPSTKAAQTQAVNP